MKAALLIPQGSTSTNNQKTNDLPHRVALYIVILLVIFEGISLLSMKSEHHAQISDLHLKLSEFQVHLTKLNSLSVEKPSYDIFSEVGFSTCTCTEEISDLNDTLSTLTSTVQIIQGVLSANVSSLSSSISSLNSSIITSDLQIASLSQTITSNAIQTNDQLALVNNVVSNTNNQIQMIGSQVSTLNSSFNSQLALVNNGLNSANNQIQALGSQVSTLNSSVNTQVALLNNGLNDTNNQIQIIEGQLSTLNSNLNNFNTFVEGLQGEVTALDSGLQETQTTISQIASELTTPTAIIMNQIATSIAYGTTLQFTPVASSATVHNATGYAICQAQLSSISNTLVGSIELAFEFGEYSYPTQAYQIGGSSYAITYVGIIELQGTGNVVLNMAIVTQSGSGTAPIGSVGFNCNFIGTTQ